MEKSIIGMFIETFSLLEEIYISTFYVNYYLCYLLNGSIIMIIDAVFRYLMSANIIIIMVTGRRTKAFMWWIKIQEGETSVPQSFWDVTVNQVLPYSSSSSAGNIFLSTQAQLQFKYTIFNDVDF